MNRAFAEIAGLVNRNAKHRKGFRLKEIPDDQPIRHAIIECTELLEAETDEDALFELADVFGYLIHYAVKKGWTVDQIDSAVVEKLNARFDPE